MDKRSYQSAGGSGGHRTDAKHNVLISKRLSWLLRHGATQEGFTFCDGGFLNVQDILRHPTFSMFTVDDVIREVETNSKKRFALRNCPQFGQLQIRANQGHSLTVENLDLKPISEATDVSAVIHGTSKRNWERIQHQGLSRMTRNHIHFSATVPGHGAISGIRNTSEVLIFIDLNRALKDGIKFYTSANNVILSPGNDEGVILPMYFQNVTHVKHEHRK